MGHANASNRCDFARPRANLKPDSSQKLTLGAIHSTRGSHTACVHSACMHRYPSRHQLQRTDMIRRRVVPFQMSTSHQKTHAHFKLKRTLAASHAGRARWRHVLRVKCNANDKLGATPTDFTAHRTRTCEPSQNAVANKAHLSA